MPTQSAWLIPCKTIHFLQRVAMHVSAWWKQRTCVPGRRCLPSLRIIGTGHNQPCCRNSLDIVSNRHRLRPPRSNHLRIAAFARFLLAKYTFPVRGNVSLRCQVEARHSTTAKGCTDSPQRKKRRGDTTRATFVTPPCIYAVHTNLKEPKTYNHDFTGVPFRMNIYTLLHKQYKST